MQKDIIISMFLFTNVLSDRLLNYEISQDFINMKIKELKYDNLSVVTEP